MTTTEQLIEKYAEKLYMESHDNEDYGSVLTSFTAELEALVVPEEREMILESPVNFKGHIIAGWNEAVQAVKNKFKEAVALKP